MARKEWVGRDEQEGARCNSNVETAGKASARRQCGVFTRMPCRPDSRLCRALVAGPPPRLPCKENRGGIAKKGKTGQNLKKPVVACSCGLQRLCANSYMPVERLRWSRYKGVTGRELNDPRITGTFCAHRKRHMGTMFSVLRTASTQRTQIPGVFCFSRIANRCAKRPHRRLRSAKHSAQRCVGEGQSELKHRDERGAAARRRGGSRTGGGRPGS